MLAERSGFKYGLSEENKITPEQRDETREFSSPSREPLKAKSNTLAKLFRLTITTSVIECAT